MLFLALRCNQLSTDVMLAAKASAKSSEIGLAALRLNRDEIELDRQELERSQAEICSLHGHHWQNRCKLAVLDELQHAKCRIPIESFNDLDPLRFQACRNAFLFPGGRRIRRIGKSLFNATGRMCNCGASIPIRRHRRASGALNRMRDGKIDLAGGHRADQMAPCRPDQPNVDIRMT